jgi:CRISPR/Cas system-associated exonuclease Cas4 (RecB family)
MYLSFSGWKKFVTCPRSYWYSYVDKTVLPTPENRVNSVYGSTVGRLFELFYSEQIWKKSNTTDILLGMIDDELDATLKKEERSGMIDWSDEKANYKSREELVADIRETIPRGLSIIRMHRLVGHDAQAEVKLDTIIDGHMIGGRADFVMTRVAPHNDLVILDGKGSRHRDTFVDDRQLLWYAMLYRLRYRIIPDKIGFVYWRSEPDLSLDWVRLSGSILDEMQTTVLEYTQKIDQGVETLSSGDDEHRKLVMAEVFQPQPGTKCRLCAYTAFCAEGQNFMSKAHKIPVYSGAGVEDVSLDI